ncbi:MAG: hypothetical protein RL033_3319 [Pseudomonadota bacterium]|jgi:hypothetical protein
MNPDTCWVCSSPARPFWSNAAFDAVACESCGHIQAQHHPTQAPSTDYHRGYDQGAFVESLRATRRRQAERMLDALRQIAANGVTSNSGTPNSDTPNGGAAHGKLSLFDFGCGRGWFLDSAKERGLAPLAGGDVSELALELLAQRGINSVRLHEQEPFERLDFTQLGFTPDVISFLDVIEHFPGDLATRLKPWVQRLPASVRWLVFKVPVSDGLMFGMANQARKLGVGGLCQQLFQVGTFPPHYQYFSRRSLARFVSSLGLDTLDTLDDLDFEPAELGGRLTSTLPWIRLLGGVAGHVLGGAATALRRADSRILIAARRPLPGSPPGTSAA